MPALPVPRLLQQLGDVARDLRGRRFVVHVTFLQAAEVRQELLSVVANVLAELHALLIGKLCIGAQAGQADVAAVPYVADRPVQNKFQYSLVSQVTTSNY